MAKNSDGIIGMIKPGNTSVEEVKKINKGRKLFPGVSGDKPKTGVEAEKVDTKNTSKGVDQPSQTGDTELQSGSLVLLDPNKVESWEHKDRKLPEIEDDPAFHRLVERIRARNGNLQPIKVRSKKEKPGYFEEIFGFKRLQACKRLNLPVLAVYEDLDDKEALLQMADENEGKSDVSAWYRALSWSSSLQAGLVASADDLALELGKDLKTVQQYLRVAEIMDPDLDRSIKLHKLGIQALLEIRSGLVELQNDSVKRQEYIDRIVEKADVIALGKASPSLFRNILLEVSGTGSAKGQDTLITSSEGAKLFSVKQQKRGYSVKMHFAASQKVSPEELETVLKDYLIKKGVDVAEGEAGQGSDLP